MKTKEEIEECLRDVTKKRESALATGSYEQYVDYRVMVATLKWVLSDE